MSLWKVLGIDPKKLKTEIMDISGFCTTRSYLDRVWQESNEFNFGGKISLELRVIVKLTDRKLVTLV